MRKFIKFEKIRENRKCIQEKMNKKWLNRGIFTCVVAIAMIGSYRYISGIVKVSSNVNGKELPIYCVQTDEKKVALSFDAAWGNDDTQRILDILKEHDVHVTFFMTGGWVESYPDDVKAIYEAGHDLGNHSQNHKNMSQLSDEEKTQELMSVHEKVKELTGVKMQLFRPPYGDYDDAVVLNARENGYYPIQWDVDSLDWKDYGAENQVKQMLQTHTLRDGEILRFHAEGENTGEMVSLLHPQLKEEGYEAVTVSQMIVKENYSMETDGRQIPESQNKAIFS